MSDAKKKIGTEEEIHSSKSQMDKIGA